mmetsp:Transcript_70647/g.155845  ORF Transcript_70647/g.155845 Transcript_70647/m.155845 type:complete len:300 (-) Transcript_70647:418-1317(-)
MAARANMAKSWTLPSPQRSKRHIAGSAAWASARARGASSSTKCAKAPRTQAAASSTLPLSSSVEPVTSCSSQRFCSEAASSFTAPASAACLAAVFEPAVRLARAPAAKWPAWGWRNKGTSLETRPFFSNLSRSLATKAKFSKPIEAPLAKSELSSKDHKASGAPDSLTDTREASRDAKSASARVTCSRTQLGKGVFLFKRNANLRGKSGSSRKTLATDSGLFSNKFAKVMEAWTLTAMSTALSMNVAVGLRMPAFNSLALAGPTDAKLAASASAARAARGGCWSPGLRTSTNLCVGVNW